MLQLNLPSYSFRIKIQNDKQFIFDNQRKKFVTLTPEEWVRQNFIRFLIEEKDYPASFIAVEKLVEVNGMRKRCDAIVYNSNFEPIMIIEFKAPQVSLIQKTFDQAAIYNSKLKVNYLIISNGLDHFSCMVDTENCRYNFLPTIPSYNSII
jgi:type I site-specific restriction endonuclease